MREHWDGPIALKGVLHPDDARRAVDAGDRAASSSPTTAAGRSTATIAALDALPGVVAAVDGRADVLFDSGVRTGSDVMKALALGAKAVLIGRPYIYGLGHRRRGRRASRRAQLACRAGLVDGTRRLRNARRCRAGAADPYTVIAWRNPRRRLRACDFCGCTKGTRVHSAVGQPIVDRLLRHLGSPRRPADARSSAGCATSTASSVLGYAWSLLEPAMFIVTYFLLLKIFTRAIRCTRCSSARRSCRGSGSPRRSTPRPSTLRQNSRLITSIALPREIYPLAEVAMKTVEFVAEPADAARRRLDLRRATRPPTSSCGRSPFVLELMICVGLALLVSSLNTVLRDIEQGIGIVIRMMFYLVAGALSAVAAVARRCSTSTSYNPMVGILEINRAVWFPAYWTGWQPVFFSAIGAVVILSLGFARLRPRRARRAQGAVGVASEETQDAIVVNDVGIKFAINRRRRIGVKDLLIEGRAVDDRHRRVLAVPPHLLPRREGRVGRHRRPQRLRQEHVAAARRRGDAARRGHHRGQRRRRRDDRAVGRLRR